MATVRPFRALRPRSGLAACIASLPYDVMDDQEARAMAQGNPYSMLRVTRAEVEMSPDTDSHAAVVYEKAKEKLAEFVEQGLLEQETSPCYYIYRQQMGTHVQTGLAAVCTVEEYESGTIRKHELTRPDKEQDRVDHILATGAQTGPVFLVYRHSPSLSAAIETVTHSAPFCDFTASDGIWHTMWILHDTARIVEIERGFAKIGSLYIADGHHRAAAAARVSHLKPEKEEAKSFLAVLFPDDEVRILDYNRVVLDLGASNRELFMNAVSEKFRIEPSAPNGDETGKPDQPHTFGMYIAGFWYLLTPLPGTIDANDRLGKLDVNILQNNLLGPVLGIMDPRTDKRVAFVGGIRGMEDLRRWVDSGRAAVAFSLFPTSVVELIDVADAGLCMPPKSTWFEPKLRDGLVIHTQE